MIPDQLVCLMIVMKFGADKVLVLDTSQFRNNAIYILQRNHFAIAPRENKPPIQPHLSSTVVAPKVARNESTPVTDLDKFMLHAQTVASLVQGKQSCLVLSTGWIPKGPEWATTGISGRLRRQRRLR